MLVWSKRYNKYSKLPWVSYIMWDEQSKRCTCFGARDPEWYVLSNAWCWTVTVKNSSSSHNRSLPSDPPKPTPSGFGCDLYTEPGVRLWLYTKFVSLPESPGTESTSSNWRHLILILKAHVSLLFLKRRNVLSETVVECWKRYKHDRFQVSIVEPLLGVVDHNSGQTSLWTM